MQVREEREALVRRVKVIARVTGLLLLALAANYWVVQVVQGSYFRELAENNRLRKLTLKAPRGTIYDRAGRVLVENAPSYNLTVDRSRWRDRASSLVFAASALTRSVADLEVVLRRYEGTPLFVPVLLAEGLTLDQVARFGVGRLEHPEFEVEVGHRRLYRLGTQGAHLLGYLGEVTDDELSRPGSGYQSGDWLGRRGIERTYDRVLRGVDGERVVVVDSRGQLVAENRREMGRPGESLTLTLDLELQQEAETWMAEQTGAVVALDPTNGEILALVSSPSYDPNLFARRLLKEDWQRLLDDERHPLQNRAIQNTYSPGSVFKVVVAAAGLAEGAISPGDRVFCGGGATYYGRRFGCWRSGGHGSVDLRAALKGSCDVYFYALGQRLGIERIARYARLFGLGRPTGIEIDGEKAGLVPDDAWSRAARGHPWYAGETISVAIGQGPLLVTPLQIAALFAATANGGHLVHPHLVRHKDGADPPAERLPVSEQSMATIREALWAVVNEQGTGAAAFVPGLDVAGKTGTVQVSARGATEEHEDLPWELRNHAWFASFAPARAPRLVVVVFIEHGGKGSRAAAPVAKALYEKYLQLSLGQLRPS